MDTSKKLPPRDEIKREDASFFVMAVVVLAITFVYLGWSLGSGAPSTTPPQAITSADAPEKAAPVILAPAMPAPPSATAPAEEAASTDARPATAEVPAELTLETQYENIPAQANAAPKSMPAAPIAKTAQANLVPPAPSINTLPQPAQANPLPVTQVAPVAPKLEPAPQPEKQLEGNSYMVEAGDTLSKIAASQLGSSRRWKEIAELNQVSPNAIHQGMKLKLPGKSLAEKPSAPAAQTAIAIVPPPPAPAAFDVPATQEAVPAQVEPAAGEASAKETAAGEQAGQPQTYVVQPTDTLSSLAQRFYGSSKSWRKIYQANADKLPNPDRLSAGVELTIPAQ